MVIRENEDESACRLVRRPLESGRKDFLLLRIRMKMEADGISDLCTETVEQAKAQPVGDTRTQFPRV